MTADNAVFKLLVTPSPSLIPVTQPLYQDHAGNGNAIYSMKSMKPSAILSLSRFDPSPVNVDKDIAKYYNAST